MIFWRFQRNEFAAIILLSSLLFFRYFFPFRFAFRRTDVTWAAHMQSKTSFWRTEFEDERTKMPNAPKSICLKVVFVKLKHLLAIMQRFQNISLYISLIFSSFPFVFHFSVIINFVFIFFNAYSSVVLRIHTFLRWDRHKRLTVCGRRIYFAVRARARLYARATVANETESRMQMRRMRGKCRATRSKRWSFLPERRRITESFVKRRASFGWEKKCFVLPLHSCLSLSCVVRSALCVCVRASLCDYY